ncbi:MAG: THUMP domain-containing protein [Candidatus Methanomethylicia archaeon]
MNNSSKLSEIMRIPSILAVTKISHEMEAGIEILDCIFPYDQNAKIRKLKFPGLVIVESILNGMEIVELLNRSECFLSQVKRVIPISIITKTEVKVIVNVVTDLSKSFSKNERTFKVELKEYGGRRFGNYIVDMIAKILKEEMRWVVKLRDPEIMICLYIFDDETIISIVERDMIWENKFLLK